VACTEEQKIEKGPDSSLQTRAVTLDAGDTNDVEVFIFKQSDNGFMHLSSVNSGWTDGKTTVDLEKGDYKFLFHRSAKLSCDMLPATMTSDAAFEHVQWNCRADEANGEGYVLPVDEIWLPETFEMSDNPYSIQAATTIRNTLTRAVSQVMVHFRKGTPETVNTRVLSTAPATVNLGTLEININGVGESVNVVGGSGTASTRVAVLEATDNGDEIITFTGPFVFPSDSEDDAVVTLTYTPNENSEIPAFTTTVNGPIERNRKLEISIWLGDEDDDPVIDGELEVTVDVVDMEDSEDSGDYGKWE